MRVIQFSSWLLPILLQGAIAIDLSVDTTVGTVVGFVDESVPHVRQWLGIPFAEPPVDSLRFLPPVPKSRGDVISAHKAPASCQQWLTTLPDIFNQLVPEFLPPPPYSEDCLYLNIITPQRWSGRSLPVLVWIHGGEATWGGINTPYEHPQKWVQHSQEHIVVQVNYRVNIFGFPNAKGLNTTNLAILDQRLALEWVRSNIKSFGGDPERIILWGQSAGAATVNAHEFAFPSDPIFSGIILQSGVALQAKTGTDLNQTSFSYVAQQMGCPMNASPEEEVACMRKVDASAIERFVQNHSDSGATPALYFSAQADGKVAFLPQQYVAKGQAGDYANVPALIGSTAQEGSSFVPFSVNGAGITPAHITAVTLKAFQCPISITCQYRQASNRTTFRYQYWGNFTNISPTPWIGAYHFSDLPLIMGTHSNYRSKSTPFESSLSHKIQHLWLAFAKDPKGGLSSQGWSPYSTTGSAVILGKNNELVQQEAIAVLDAGCAAS